MPLKHLQHMQHPPIHFYNINIKQLQYTSETPETLEAYICNRGGEGWAGRFWPSRREPAASHGARAPPAPPALMGALGSAGEDMRCHNMCAPTALVGSAACTTTMGDGWTNDEGASGTGDWDGCAARPTMRHGAVGRRAWHGSCNVLPPRG
jgi:hypothetical protein